MTYEFHKFLAHYFPLDEALIRKSIKQNKIHKSPETPPGFQQQNCGSLSGNCPINGIRNSFAKK
jgi:hypothetical protein